MSAEKIVQIALKEVGYLEKASNNSLDDKTANVGYNNWTKYGAWYGEGLNGQAWCNMFVSWCADQAGESAAVGKYAYCPYHVSFFKKLGRWHDKTEIPQTGDIIFFCHYPSTEAAHVGIVEKYANGYVYTIEGNTSTTGGLIPNGGGVFQKVYTTSYQNILGYGRPDYSVEPIEEEEQEEEEMTQEKFNQMMSTWITEQAALETDATWSAAARAWAESNGYIKGDEFGHKMYKKYLTREEFVTVLHRIFDSLGFVK